MLTIIAESHTGPLQIYASSGECGINGRLTYSTNAHRWEMDFNLLQASTGRVRIAADKELPDLTKEGQRTIRSSQGLSRLIGPWKVCFLECLQGVILRNG